MAPKVLRRRLGRRKKTTTKNWWTALFEYSSATCEDALYASEAGPELLVLQRKTLFPATLRFAFWFV